jgi:hypothetical protein
MTTQLTNGVAAGTAVEWWKDPNNKPAKVFATQDPSENLSEGIGASYAVIGYKGKNWSIRLRGENHILFRPDDGTPVSYLDVVILRAAKVKAKSYYPGGFEENASAGKRPDCASLDGVRPDLDVINKQSELCALCPRNEFRTNVNGRKGKECTDYKRLAVLVLPSQTTPLFGQPLMEPAFLRVPAASLQALATFGDNMASQGWPYYSFVTRVQFDSQKSHPEFVFKPVARLTDEEAKMVLTMREEPLAKRITGEDEIERKVNVQTQGAALVSQMTPAKSIGLGAPTGVNSEGYPINQARQVVQQAPTVQQVSREPVQHQTLEMHPSPGGAFVVAPPADQPAPNPGAMVGQTADDVGTAVDDPDLDAKIAALMTTV